MIQTLTIGGGNAGVIGYYGGSYNNLDIRAGSGVGSQLYLTTNGKVGIGTTTPQNTLNVNGAINATGSIYSNGAVVLTSASLSETDPLWSGNYTAYNSSWSTTYNSTYHSYNTSGLIKDWNSTGFIKDWNSTGLIMNWSFIDTNTEYTAGQDLELSGTEFKTNRTSLQEWIATLFFPIWDYDYGDLINVPTKLSDFIDDLGAGNWTADKTNYYTITDIDGFNYYNGTNPQPVSNYTEDEIEAFIFDDDNTANLNMSNYNITAVDCIYFTSGGSICSA